MEACIIDEKTETRAMNWLERMLEDLLTEKSIRGRSYSPHTYSPNEICYRNEEGYTLVYAVKKDSNSTYLIEFEEVEKEPKGICHLNLYRANSQKSTSENRIFHAEFENENQLVAKAAAARGFMMLAGAKAITPELLAQIKEHATSAEIDYL